MALASRVRVATGKHVKMLALRHAPCACAVVFTLEPQATIAVTMDLGAATNIAGAWPAAGTGRQSAYDVEWTIDAIFVDRDVVEVVLKALSIRDQAGNYNCRLAARDDAVLSHFTVTWHGGGSSVSSLRPQGRRVSTFTGSVT